MVWTVTTITLWVVVVIGIGKVCGTVPGFNLFRGKVCILVQPTIFNVFFIHYSSCRSVLPIMGCRTFGSIRITGTKHSRHVLDISFSSQLL
ncbi:hypothetical protein ACOMHN_002044 [Nucella lapillus]